MFIAPGKIELSDKKKLLYTFISNAGLLANRDVFDWTWSAGMARGDLDLHAIGLALRLVRRVELSNGA